MIKCWRWNARTAFWTFALTVGFATGLVGAAIYQMLTGFVNIIAVGGW